MAAEPLITLDGDRYRATFVGRIPPRRGRADSTLMVLRNRYVGDGMREDIVLLNVGPEAAGVLITVAVEADFADLFEVKECRAIPGWRRERRPRCQQLDLYLDHARRDPKHAGHRDQ